MISLKRDSFSNEESDSVFVVAFAAAAVVVAVVVVGDDDGEIGVMRSEDMEIISPSVMAIH